jgi:NAD(P)-dependent dehydrogenase (short-subunit alcohol dehydrogenase family)
MKSFSLVTGATSAIGRDVAKQFPEKGVAVRDSSKARKQFGPTSGWRHLIIGLLDKPRSIGTTNKAATLSVDDDAGGDQ